MNKLPECVIFIDFYFFHFNFLIEVQLIFNAVLISALQQSDSAIHIYTLLFYNLFHYDLSQETEYSYL